MGATHKWRGPEVMAQLRKNVREIVMASGITVQTEMKVRLSQPGSGRLYKSRKGGRTLPAVIVRGKRAGQRRNLREQGYHQASAPGESPAPDTGHLRRSTQTAIGRDEAGLGEQSPRIRVGTNIPYGKFLELGTLHIAPRPWARPASVQARPKIRRLFSSAALLRGIR